MGIRLDRHVLFSTLFLSSFGAGAQKAVNISTPKLSLSIQTDQKACISGIVVNGQKVLSRADGAFTSATIDGVTYSSMQLSSAPAVKHSGDSTIITPIEYGDKQHIIRERWVFFPAGDAVRWKIERRILQVQRLDASTTPIFQFDNMKCWDGAYQGYGGLAWFYLFNEKLCTYGVHTHSSSFWNGSTGNGLDVTVEAPGKQVAMKYTRAADDRLVYGITVSDQEMLPRYDSGTNRRRFIRGKTDVWASYNEHAGKTEQTITLRYFDVNDRYGRGNFAGIDGKRISAVLNTIARIGVIDSLHFGGNSWHTPYGPICLHEQYIAQMGLAINDPNYLKGYQSCLDFYRDHAFKPDGRVFARWAYTNEDMMPGEVNKEGFYEAQWGILMDANPDFVSNVADLYDLTGDRKWVKGQQTACERALDWIITRDTDGNGLVEMMTDNEKQKRGSDWIDIIWASYENAFVNARLYHALVEWAAIERQLNNDGRAGRYVSFASKLKAAFNRPVQEGGFWDDEKGCYIHWRDKDGSAHGRNMVTPVNFMAIAYGICDDQVRSRHILDTIETQMQREKLFFWPLCMTSYASGEGNDWQFPFPNYENGDLFLSWGSIAAAAYATYRPEIAVKYIRKVLDQYGKDGLAFQRYGRLHQDGLGDDILSGNCLAIVGLYQAIYGINPRYNRLYLDPHITPELAGTELRYNFRGGKLTIRLDKESYEVGDRQFRIRASEAFGFFHKGDTLLYFSGAADTPSLAVVSPKPFVLSVSAWQRELKEWSVSTASPVDYIFRGLRPGVRYSLFRDGKAVKTVVSDPRGVVRVRGVAGLGKLSMKECLSSI